MLTAQLPATAAEKTADRDRQAAALRRQLKKIETSQAALMTELEETGADPAAAEYRQRIRDRYRDRAAERAAAEQQLAELETQTAAADDPALLAAIPRAAGKFTTAPPEIREALYTALDVQILYRPDQNQMTIWVTITDATPQAIQDLLDDPRTDSDTGHPAETGPRQQHRKQHPGFWHPCTTHSLVDDVTSSTFAAGRPGVPAQARRARGGLGHVGGTRPGNDAGSHEQRRGQRRSRGARIRCHAVGAGRGDGQERPDKPLHAMAGRPRDPGREPWGTRGTGQRRHAGGRLPAAVGVVRGEPRRVLDLDLGLLRRPRRARRWPGPRPAPRCPTCTGFLTRP